MTYATTEGTKKYSLRKETSKNHFRTTMNKSGSLTLSSLGLGTYLGSIDKQTDELVENAIIKSVESGGINVIDTAINYRYQRAERSIGRAIKQLLNKREYSRSEIFISTKNGYIPGDGDDGIDPRTFIQGLIGKNIVEIEDVVEGVHCMSAPFLEDQLKRSQVNLRLQTIDLMYLHNAAEAQLGSIGLNEFMTRLRDAFMFYEEKRKENRLRFYGLATWNCFRVPPTNKNEFLSLEDVVNLAEEVGGINHGFRFVQIPINLGMTEAFFNTWQQVQGKNLSFLKAAEKLGIGVFASVPLMQTQLFRSKIPSFHGLDAKAQRCLQFVRSIPSKSLIAPLVGQKTPKHIEENLELISISPLNEEEFQNYL
ncbi:MAG: aldo/keto reductase [Candidatus Hodarchaeales archaeon]